MSDAADEAKDPVLSTPGDKEREPGVERTDLGADDVPPRKRPGRPKGSKAKAKEPLTQTALAAASEAKDLRKLKKQLTSILTLPSTAFDLLGEDWPATHVEGAAPPLAAAIIKRAEKDPAFKRRLQRSLQGGESAELFFTGLAYAGPLILYFTQLGPPQLRDALDIPPRGKRPGYMSTTRGRQPDIDGDGKPISEEELQREAESKGFDDVEAYKAAVRAAVSRAVDSIHGPIADPPSPKT